MIEVPVTEFARNIGRYTEIVKHEPVAVTSEGQTSGYFVSASEFDEYRRLKERATRAYYVSELPQETVDAIEASRMDPIHDHLNDLLERDDNNGG
jgi:hypothetical protein